MHDSSSLESTRRPLSAQARRLIRARIGAFTARRGGASHGVLAIAGGIVALLWVLTLLASDAPWPVVTGFWLVAGAVIALWSRRDVRAGERQIEEMARRLQSALRRDEAEVHDIRASAFAEFEEVEDEGACYAFQIDEDRVVFIVGQEFYESGRFPSLDFSLAYVLDEDDRPVDMVIEKRGPRAAPARRIPAAIKRELEAPEHLEIRQGRIEDLERILSPLRPSRG